MLGSSVMWGIEPRRAAPARNPCQGCESAF
jgi:hypothetical protein